MEIEGRNSDFCYYQYKNDLLGRWITFESYGDIEVDDDEWDIYTKDLSTVADGKSYFQLRFYCTTDKWTEGSGLYLDDIQISWSRDDELQIIGEPQSQLPKSTEFDIEPEKMTDALITEYEQETATTKIEIQNQEEKLKTEAELSEKHAMDKDPNSINSALATLIEQFESFESAPEVKPKVESEYKQEITEIKTKTQC
jgi:hypothetical protein